jgi:succinate-semialdehyde dehydrogenase/glutarate-semialdehyde dehydrogenase
MTTTASLPARAAARPPTGSKRIDHPTLDLLAARVTTQGERQRMEVEKPFTAETLGSVPHCTAEDVEAAITRARVAQATWRRTSFEQRKRVLLRFHDLVLARQDEILDLLQLESGKARRHAFEEILDVAVVARYYANTARRHLRSHRRRGALPFLTAAWEHRHPVGVVAIIAPWNYPFTLSMSDATPALAAGNAVVVKPDSQTPFSTLWGAALLEEAGLPPGLFEVVTGPGSQLGDPLIDGSDYLMFTGSTATGRKVAAQAAQNLIPCSMELGGKNAMIVLDDASLGRAVAGATRALFSNAGQLCISAERLMVHESVADEFTRRLVERTRAMKLDAGLGYRAEMGSLVSHSQLETVREHVEDATAKGATVLVGGRPRPDIGPYFHEPTLLEGVREGMTCFEQETFGPVAAVSTFASEEEAIARANASDYGLNFSLWTADAARGRRVASQLEAGTVNVNEGYAAAWGSVDAPMGGMKGSGLGRRHGAHGIQKYTEEQTVALQRVLPIAPPRYVGQRLWGKAMAVSLRLLRRLPGVR